MHRLNNKIGTIPERVEGLRDKNQASLEQDEYLANNLEQIRASAVAAMEVIQETLYHLRPFQVSSVAVTDCVQEALNSIHLPADVQVYQEDLETLPCVQAGMKRLTLALINLLENAIDAMSGEGRPSASEKVQMRTGCMWPSVTAGLASRRISTREFSSSVIALGR
jgi:C4-dicarboxylate-specific signal transduction histidine kinase